MDMQLFAQVSSTPQVMRPPDRGAREQYAENCDARGGEHDLPFAFDAIRDAIGQQRSERRTERDEKRILQAVCGGDARRDQQRGHPGREPVVTDGLEKIEDHQHERAFAVRRERASSSRVPRVSAGRDATSDAPRKLRRGGSACRFPFEISLDARFHRSGDAFGFVEFSVRHQPARAFRQAAANEPHENRAQRSGQDHPAPALQAERLLRHQPPRKQRDGWQRGESHDLAEGNRAAAQLPRHQLSDVSVYRDQLDADAHARDHAPQDNSPRRVLERHHDRGGGVPQQRRCENQAAARNGRRRN